MDPRIRDIEDEYRRDDLPAFSPGDTVRVRVRVQEGDKERLQAFEGVCIARRGAGVNETFTVRKISGGVGVERIFPIHSPSIAGIEVTRRGQVRRAKLYFLRERQGKKARVKERSWWLDQQAAREAAREGGSAPTDGERPGAAAAGEEEGGEPPSKEPGPETSAESGEASPESEPDPVEEEIRA